MIIIAGTIDLADPAKRDEEPGCRAYVFAADPCVPGRIAVYELWEDEGSLAAHFKHRNYFNMRDMLGSVGLAGADNKKYRCDLAEPVYDTTGTPRADFFTGH